jgi:hypothetical protein
MVTSVPPFRLIDRWNRIWAPYCHVVDPDLEDYAAQQQQHFQMPHVPQQHPDHQMPDAAMGEIQHFQPPAHSPTYEPATPSRGSDMMDLNQLATGGWDHFFPEMAPQAPPQWGYQHPEPDDVYMTANMPTTEDIMARLESMQISQASQFTSLLDTHRCWYERYAALVREQRTRHTLSNASTQYSPPRPPHSFFPPFN